MKNAISWFEIPTTKLDQAQAFYESVLARFATSKTADTVGFPPEEA